MTFEQFVSNDEQREAHFVAYQKVWNGCIVMLLDALPDLTEDELLCLMEEGFEYYLIDFHLGIQMQGAPEEMYAEFFKEFPAVPTPRCVANNLIRYYHWRKKGQP